MENKNLKNLANPYLRPTLLTDHLSPYDRYKLSLLPGERCMTYKEFMRKQGELTLSKQLGNMIF